MKRARDVLAWLEGLRTRKLEAELPPTPVRVPAAWFSCAEPGCAELAPSWDGQAPEGWRHDRCDTGGSAAYCPAHAAEHASPVTRADLRGRGGT